jgi:hypothetical protein
MISPAGARRGIRFLRTGFPRGRLSPWREGDVPLLFKEAKRERGTKLKGRRIFLAALLAAGAAAFFLAVLRRRKEDTPATPYARPEGGEREGEFELFIGS